MAQGKQNSGVTLVEMVVTILLITILTGLSVSLVGDYGDAGRYEETREKMEKIRQALIGDGTVSMEGRRKNFGYHGDWGSLPAALSDLSTAQLPAWTYDAVYGVGAGWRGPYVESEFSASAALDVDAWGNNFVWAPAANPPTLTSLGADGVVGGTVYAQDLVLSFPSSTRLGTVHGFVLDSATGLSGRNVEIRYPVNGVLTAFNTNTDANGYFQFLNVPQGARSIRVTTAPVLGPKQIIVDQTQYQIPQSTLNYAGAVQRVFYQIGTAAAGGAGNRTVTALLSSTYDFAIRPDFVTFSWTGGGRLFWLDINGVGNPFLLIPSGTRANLLWNPIIPANSVNNTLQLNFNQDMTNQTVMLIFEWLETADTDTVTLDP